MKENDKSPLEGNELKSFLDEKVAYYNHPRFIEVDPICIPHRYSHPLDVEVSAFFAAAFAWGQRVTIINKTNELLARMGAEPHDFILNSQANDWHKLDGFVHRTFNGADAVFFFKGLQRLYKEFGSMGAAMAYFSGPWGSVELMLTQFHTYMFVNCPPANLRSRKHLATPARGSSCKRLNMLLRWMVRQDKKGVDFGLWKQIPMANLICPTDVHVERTARKLGLMTRKQVDWLAANELTAHLRQLCPEDPVKYDFALFGLGLEGF